MADNVNEVIGKLKKPDVYSVMCSLLFDLHKDPKYSTLSELCYLLDIDSLLNLIQYFQGLTIRIPTKEEFSDVMQVLQLYQLHEVENRPWKDCVTLAGFDSGSGKLAKNKLEKLKAVLDNNNFDNRDY